MSQADFARRAGFSTGQVSMWANGDRHPSPASCKRIADVLFVDLDEVLTIAGHRDPDLDGDPRSDAVRRLQPLIDAVAWNERMFKLEEQHLRMLRDMQTGAFQAPEMSDKDGEADEEG